MNSMHAFIYGLRFVETTTGLQYRIMVADKRKAGKSEDVPDKKDFSNFISQMKYAAEKGNAMKSELLVFYNGLTRFDDEKAKIVKQWKSDKNCQWWQEYKEKHVKSTEHKSNKLKGFGTRNLLNC